MRVGGYFGSTLRIGEGPDRSEEGTRGASALVRSSVKFKIQLPVALFKFGMSICILYIFLEAKISSGFAPGGSAVKFGGAVLTASSSDVVFGRVISVCGVGAVIFSASPSPDIPLFAGGFPPRMLMSATLLPALVPPVLLDEPVAGPFAPGVSLGEPTGTPGFLPSGEMETRARRFPCGGTTGAGGAGVAESAINVEELPFSPDNCVLPTSGAGARLPR